MISYVEHLMFIGHNRYLEANENEDIIIQNLWDTGKAILRGKFIASEAYLKKTRKSSNNLTSHLKELEKRTTSKAQSK